jgi:hypothetical protein
LTHETYCATAAQTAFVDNWNSTAETAFRTARSWIPATSTVNPEITKYNFSFNVVDHPAMGDFVTDDALVGTWTAVADFVQNIGTFTPGTRLYWAGVKFANDGTVQQRNATGYDNAGAGNRFSAWKPMGTWTKTTETGEFVSKGIINAYALAPEYTIKAIDATNYLFVQDKNEYSYGQNASKPTYYVFAKVEP